MVALQACHLGPLARNRFYNDGDVLGLSDF